MPLSLFVSLAASCGVAAPNGPRARVAEAPRAPLVAPPPPHCGGSTGSARALDVEPRQSSSVVLVRDGAELVALVANRLSSRIDVVDVKKHALVRSIALAGGPETLLPLADGRILVSLPDKGAIEVAAYATDPSGAPPEACLLDAPSGPSGMALTEDKKTVLLASASAGKVTFFDVASMDAGRSVDVPRSPHAIDIEGGRAFVSHLAGDEALSVIDVDRATPERGASLALLPLTQHAPETARVMERAYRQAYALASVSVDGPASARGEADTPLSGSPPSRQLVTRIIVPGVTVDPGERDPRRASRVYYGPPPVEGITKEMPVAMTVDVATERPLMKEIVAQSDQLYREECMLPRAAALRASTNRLYVACRGIDRLLELDATALDPMRVVYQRIGISKGVTGIAIADAEGLAVSFGEFDGALDIVKLSDGTRETVKLDHDEPALSRSFKQGRELFYKTDDTRITADGVGCANCHPDGMDDGLTWSTPEGPRQTPMLAGRVHGTAPYGWTRDQATLPDYITDTIGRLGGSGLSASELVALASYVERMDAPLPPLAKASEVEEGRTLFVVAGCDECHSEADGTDHRSHAVTPEAAVSIDTPSLRFVGLTAPYFHDGRYPTLDAVLSDASSLMAPKLSLSARQRASLVRYLETL